jgi:uncharacterized membrane protein YoaK (UPF0700 family)
MAAGTGLVRPLPELTSSRAAAGMLDPSGPIKITVLEAFCLGTSFPRDCRPAGPLSTFVCRNAISRAGLLRLVTDAVSGPEDAERSATLWFAVLLTLTNGFLDAHTYIARGHVFANVQTANVIFSAIHVSDRQFSAALAHTWPLLAFIAGMLLASHIKSGRVGNLMRFMESGYESLVDKRAEARRPLVVYGTLIVAFASGALVGAYATGAWSVHAIWLPASFLAITLCLFLVEQREWMR